MVKANLVELGVDLAEVGLDQFLKEGVVREIPVLRVLAGVNRTLGMVRDRLFTMKVIRFLAGYGEIPIDERERFLSRHEKPAERRRLGETLVLLLDRLDDMHKPEALARLFAAHVRGECDWETFQRLSAALDRVPLGAIPHLQTFYQDTQQFVFPQFVPRPGPYHSQFVSAGLITIEFMKTGPVGGPGGHYTKNDLGALFLKILAAPPDPSREA